MTASGPAAYENLPPVDAPVLKGGEACRQIIEPGDDILLEIQGTNPDSAEQLCSGLAPLPPVLCRRVAVRAVQCDFIRAKYLMVSLPSLLVIHTPYRTKNR